MKALLRSIDGKGYFRAPGTWVASRAEALNFGTGSAAIEFAIRSELEQIEIVLELDFGQEDIVVPLRSSRSPRDHRAG